MSSFHGTLNGYPKQLPMSWRTFFVHTDLKRWNNVERDMFDKFERQIHTGGTAYAMAWAARIYVDLYIRHTQHGRVQRGDI